MLAPRCRDCRSRRAVFGPKGSMRRELCELCAKKAQPPAPVQVAAERVRDIIAMTDVELLDLSNVDVREVPILPSQLAARAGTWLDLKRIRLSSSGCDGAHMQYALTAGQETLKLLEQNIGPKDLTVLAVIFRHLPTFTAALTELSLAGNVLFGAQKKYCGKRGGYNHLHDDDANQGGWSAFCDALRTLRLRTLDLQDVGMGPHGLTKLASLFCDNGGVCGGLSQTIVELKLGKNPLTGAKFTENSEGIVRVLHFVTASDSHFRSLTLAYDHRCTRPSTSTALPPV
eukprot:SAG31_NODE_2346_length_5902_cov_23.293814_2_plen_286_part_00